MSSVIANLLAKQNIKVFFENLKDSEFKITSPKDAQYNCIAFAADDQTRWWWSVGNKYWLKGVPKTESPKSFILAFQKLGYKICESADLEEGFEKVAIYTRTIAAPNSPKGTTTHMAKQLPDGRWKSKLGKLEDIEHNTLESICGKAYGEVKHILKRPIKKEKIK